MKRNSKKWRFELKPNDLIMSCSGTMGKVAIVPSKIVPGIINQALLKISPHDCLLPKYLSYWISSPNFQTSLIESSAGAAIKNVASVKILKEIKIPVPSLEEQRRVVSILSETFVNTKIGKEKAQQQISLFDTLEQSALKKAFNGEL